MNDEFKTALSLKGRDSKGRFVKGHVQMNKDILKDSATGRFIRKPVDMENIDIETKVDLALRKYEDLDNSSLWDEVSNISVLNRGKKLIWKMRRG